MPGSHTASEAQPGDPSWCRRAFTLTELLVVLGILGVLAAVVTPAVQRVRATAQLTDCGNRLRQIGLALNAYHAIHGALPPGMSLKLDNGAFPYLSWQARILPYLEQEKLWDEVRSAYAADPNFLHVPPHVRRGTVVRALTCPADSRSADVFDASTTVRVAFTAYLGVEGTDQFARDGLLYCDSQVRLGDVSDGTSNTLLVGERPPSTDSDFGWWYAGWGQEQDGSAEMVLGVRERLTYVAPCPSGASSHFGPGSYSNECDFLHFWSLHPGGSNFLFADGSVRYLGYDADALLPALATRAGNEDNALP